MPALAGLVIDQTDEALSGWVREVREGLHVSFAPPADELAGEGVSLYLMDLRNAPVTATGARPPHQIVLRYLVTAWGETPAAAHRILADVVFAAMSAPDFEVELEALPPSLWSAFGVAPRPAFVLRVPLRRERPEQVAPLVRHQPGVEIVPATALHGSVLGPGDRPYAGARVELPRLALVTRTDLRGRFRFPTVPRSGEPQTVRVSIRGQEVTAEAASGDAPLVIRLQPHEEETA